jgi:hypothetical protein
MIKVLSRKSSTKFPKYQILRQQKNSAHHWVITCKPIWYSRQKFFATIHLKGAKEKKMLRRNRHPQTAPFMTARLGCQEKQTTWKFPEKSAINCNPAYFCKVGGDRVNRRGIKLAAWKNNTDDQRMTQIQDANQRQANQLGVRGKCTLPRGTYGSDITTENSPFLVSHSMRPHSSVPTSLTTC